MIEFPELLNLFRSALHRDITEKENKGQYDVVHSDVTQSLFVVAGPGSGKTTAIVLKIMKLIFVDEIEPISIMATTFTRKAAKELESRILGWGDQLKKAMINDPSFSGDKKKVDEVDFTRIKVGTIDSLAQDIMAEYRLPGEIEPVIIEDFVSTSLMLRHVLFEKGRFKDPNFKKVLIDLYGTGYKFNTRTMASILGVIKDRVNTDMVDLDDLESRAEGNPGMKRLVHAIQDYQRQLTERNLFDYGKLETEFLRQLKTDKLEKFLKETRFLLVDEYQDTNLLQETIYFEIVKSVKANDGSITVVGDDDQSLYRFRGATVELFRDFRKRLKEIRGVDSLPVYLSKNYRSTNDIVSFVNSYVKLDPKYQEVRVADKPEIGFNRKNTEEAFVPDYPILSLFRNDIIQLSKDLTSFVIDVTKNGGYELPSGEIIKLDDKLGSLADIAFLASSPQEKKPNRERLPFHLKQKLEKAGEDIRVFNPRGINVEDDEQLSILNGLVLSCIDPLAEIQNNMEKLPHEMTEVFDLWREKASYFLDKCDELVRKKSLQEFINEVTGHSSTLDLDPDPLNFSLVDLIYQLVSWMPDLHNDIEGLAYLELITRSVEQSSVLTPSIGTITLNTNDPTKEKHSIEETIWNIFVPLASGAVDLNEDLFETLPSNKINVMSLHQAKGLEFPLVIVDVGSDFSKNYAAQKMLRFPDNSGLSGNIEEFLRVSSPLKASSRSQRDKAFDDLIRKFFVGYSRAKDCLLLVGLTPSKFKVQNIATGTLRTGEEMWSLFSEGIIEI